MLVREATRTGRRVFGRGVSAQVRQIAVSPHLRAAGARAEAVRAALLESKTGNVALTVTLLAVFVPVLVVPYGFSDDYPMLWMALSGHGDPEFGKTIFDWSAGGGRLLAGPLTSLLYATAGTVAKLWIIRAVSVTGILVLGLLMRWSLLRAGLGRMGSVILALLVLTLPAFEIYGFWAIDFSAPYAALLGAGASLIAADALNAGHQVRKASLFWATALLVAGLLMYQPAAMFFWVFLAIALVGVRNRPKRAKELFVTHLGVGVAALASYFASVKLTIWLIGAGASTQSTRTNLTHHPLGKLLWFVSEPLPRSLNLTNVGVDPFITILVVTLVAAGILRIAGERESRIPAVLPLALIPLSYLPSLLAREDLAAYRTLSALSSLVALYACLGIIGLWDATRQSLIVRLSARPTAALDHLARGAATVVFAAIALAAVRNVATLLVIPQDTELRLLRTQVANLPTNTNRVAFIETAGDEGMTNVSVAEFGEPSSARPWALRPMVDLLLREEGRLSSQSSGPIIDLIFRRADDLSPRRERRSLDLSTLPNGEPVLDLRGLRLLR